MRVRIVAARTACQLMLGADPPHWRSEGIGVSLVGRREAYELP